MKKNRMNRPRRRGDWFDRYENSDSRYSRNDRRNEHPYGFRSYGNFEDHYSNPRYNRQSDRPFDYDYGGYDRQYEYGEGRAGSIERDYRREQMWHQRPYGQHDYYNNPGPEGFNRRPNAGRNNWGDDFGRYNDRFDQHPGYGRRFDPYYAEADDYNDRYGGWRGRSYAADRDAWEDYRRNEYPSGYRDPSEWSNRYGRQQHYYRDEYNRQYEPDRYGAHSEHRAPKMNAEPVEEKSDLGNEAKNESNASPQEKKSGMDNGKRGGTTQ